MNYVAEYLKYLKVQRNYSSKTIHSYEIDIDEFLAYLETKKINLFKVSYNDIHPFLKDCFCLL